MPIQDIFEFNVINSEIIIRYIINLFFAALLIRVIYFYNYKRTDLFLTFFSFNSIIFFVSYMLNKVELSTGAAFGLFAVFSILRYRTEGLSAKDMTYLFLNIAIGLLSAVSIGNFLEIIFICTIITLLTFLLESDFILHKEDSKVIQCDDISLVNNNNKENLIEFLKLKTGLNIKRLVIKEIDFLKDSFTVIIYYTEK